MAAGLGLSMGGGRDLLAGPLAERDVGGGEISRRRLGGVAMQNNRSCAVRLLKMEAWSHYVTTSCKGYAVCYQIRDELCASHFNPVQVFGYTLR